MRVPTCLLALLIPAFLVSASLIAGCGAKQEAPVIEQAKARGKLIVAMEPTFRPFEWEDENGDLQGFDVDLARELGKDLGVEIEFLPVAWNSIIPTLIAGKADLIISGMTATEERAKTVAYSEPYFHTVTCLLVSKKRAADVKGIADLNQEGRLVAVKEGTTGHNAALESCKKAKIAAVETENDAANEVVLGRADAFLYDLWSIRKHNSNHPDTTFVIDTPISREPYAIACRKGDPRTIAWLNRVLEALRSSGRLEKMYEKYGLEDVR